MHRRSHSLRELLLKSYYLVYTGGLCFAPSASERTSGGGVKGQGANDTKTMSSPTDIICFIRSVGLGICPNCRWLFIAHCLPAKINRTTGCRRAAHPARKPPPVRSPSCHRARTYVHPHFVRGGTRTSPGFGLRAPARRARFTRKYAVDSFN